MPKLTDKQQEIINYIDGPILVTAGPGSGKTRVLTQRMANIITERKGRVLALTFSNKAAEEISDRIAKQVSEDALNRVQVGTIHSFCLDIVINKGNLIGLPSGLSILEGQKDKLELLKKIYTNYNDAIPVETQLREILLKIQDYKQRFISPGRIDKNIQNIDFIDVYESYNNLLIANRVIDFDDILFYAYKILMERPKVAATYTRLYKYILIDEAQDLNDTQYKIIRALTRGFLNIMMVGDSAQSIYGFNGSNSKIMTDEFVRDYNPKIFSLNENFRSTAKIIEAAKKIQPSTNSQAVFPLDGELEIIPFLNEIKEAEWIAEKIRYLLSNGSKWLDRPIELEDIAIIGRNRYLFNNIEKIFNENQISYSFGNSGINLESETIEMKIFETGMRVLVNPFDDLHYGQVNSLASRNPNQPEDYLVDLLNNREVGNFRVNISVFNSIVDAWNILYKNQENFSKCLSTIESSLNANALDENFRFLIQNDIDLWKNRWSKYCKQTVQGDRSLAYFRNQVSLGKMNTDNNSGVSLLTVHMSKGLEFEVVFIIGLTQGTFPDYRVDTVAQQQEELNNMFVAITRAKRECYLTYPENKMMPWGSLKRQNPSEYLTIIV